MDTLCVASLPLILFDFLELFFFLLFIFSFLLCSEFDLHLVLFLN